MTAVARRCEPVLVVVAPPRSRRAVKEVTWPQIAARAPVMAATMANYLDQLAVSSRPATVVTVDLALRLFAGRVTTADPSCRSVASIGRVHIEDFKTWQAARPGRGGKLQSTTTIRHRLSFLRTFFERLIEWDDDDAPVRVPIFSSDFPALDEQLPKFLDDPTAAKFMAALAIDPDPRRRLMVELSARTGMRAGELAGLRDDAMVRIGDTSWLRIPVGKLHNDRYVPLLLLLVGLIDDHHAARGPSRSGYLLERDDGNPTSAGPSTATWQRSPSAPASATSTPTSCATRSRPRRSIGA